MKIRTFLFLFLLSCLCRAQRPWDSGWILLNNYDANAPIFYLHDGNRASGPGFYVQILGGPVGGALQPILNDLNKSVFPLGDFDPGFFEARLGYIPGVPADGLADIQVRAWHGAASFDAASERVISGIVSGFRTGDDRPPAPPNPAAFVFFPKGLVIVPIPEPSATCLLLLGASLWLIRPIRSRSNHCWTPIRV